MPATASAAGPRFQVRENLLYPGSYNVVDTRAHGDQVVVPHLTRGAAEVAAADRNRPPRRAARTAGIFGTLRLVAAAR